MKTTIKTVVAQVEVPVKQTGWNRFWMRMNGNRTLILSMIATTVSLTPVPEPYKSISLGILALLGAKTGYEHIKNGAFKPSVKGVIIEK